MREVRDAAAALESRLGRAPSRDEIGQQADLVLIDSEALRAYDSDANTTFGYREAVAAEHAQMLKDYRANAARYPKQVREKRIAAIYRGNGPRSSEPLDTHSFDGYLLDLAKAPAAMLWPGLLDLGGSPAWLAWTLPVATGAAVLSTM